MPCFVLLFALYGIAQSNAAFGELRGVVTDPDRAVIPHARVTVTNELTSERRTVSSGELGDYRFLFLLRGNYTVQFEAENFRTQRISGVRVSVGRVATLEAAMDLGGLAEVEQVLGTADLIEIHRINQANTLQKEFLENLPIGRRDYLTFSLLVPGIVDTTALVDNADFRPKQTPNGGMGIFGSNGRGNAVTLDGGEMNDAGGGIRSTVSQEAVQEFQVNRSNYSAELGGATGAVINIISKAGSNEAHGTAFAFFRDGVFNAAYPFARVLQNGTMVRTKPPERRQQFGGSVGMPLQKDRTFFFGAFEGLKRNESAATSLFADTPIFKPSPGQETMLNTLPAAVAGPLRAALTAPQTTIDFFERNSGVFPYTTASWKFSVRLDHAAGNDRLFFRHNYSHLRETNANLQALYGASRGTDTYQLDPTTAAGWTLAAGANLVNSLTVQWSYRGFNLSSVDKLGPDIRIAGYGFFNRDAALPSRTIERRTEVRDNLTNVRGRHTLKAGGNLLVRGMHSDNEILFGGLFTFGPLPGTLLNPAVPPSFTINALQAYSLGLAQTYFQAFGTGIVNANNPYYALYIEDTWQPERKLTLNGGLRYELDVRTDAVHTSKNNFAPRVGFAWNPTGDRKTVVRGGYGIFFAPIYFQTDWAANIGAQRDGTRRFAQLSTTIQTPGQLAAPNVFSTLRAQGVIGNRSITAADVTQFGANLSLAGPLPPFSAILETSPDYTNPYSQQASLSIDREIGRNAALSFGYTFIRTLNIARTRDRNLIPAPVDPTLGVRVWSAPYFVDPLLAQRILYESTGQAVSHGLVAELRRRFARGFSLEGNYTFSKAIDEGVDFGPDYSASDQTNLKGERALSSFDQRHKVVLYALWDAPAGFKLAPIFRANSSRPFNLLAGFDVNQDRRDRTDRPPFAGRNTGIGPSFWTLDMRIARAVRFDGEHRELEFIAEAFNLFNRLNLAGINNTVGLMTGPFDVRGRNDRPPNQPLGFTSAHETRKLQFGARLRF